MPPQNQSRLHTNDVNLKLEQAEDEISYDKSLDSVDISIDSQEEAGEKDTNISGSIQNNFSEGLSRFFANWRILLLGQLLSLLLASSGAFSASMHFNCNISAPTMQTALVFFLMSFHVIPLLCKKKKRPNSKNPENVNHELEMKGVQDLALGSSISLDSADILRSNSTKTFNHRDPDEENKPHSTCCGLLPLAVPWWAYALFSWILVEASYFTFLALRYTTLPSAALLDNTNIFAAMVGSKFILKRRYSGTHILGAIICCLGVFLNITAEYRKSEEDISDVSGESEKVELEEYPKRLLGDSLAIIGGLFVGLCDVVTELVVKDFVSVNEYLGKRC